MLVSTLLILVIGGLLGFLVSKIIHPMMVARAKEDAKMLLRGTWRVLDKDGGNCMVPSRPVEINVVQTADGWIYGYTLVFGHNHVGFDRANRLAVEQVVSFVEKKDAVDRPGWRQRWNPASYVEVL